MPQTARSEGAGARGRASDPAGPILEAAAELFLAAGHPRRRCGHHRHAGVAKATLQPLPDEGRLRSSSGSGRRPTGRSSAPRWNVGPAIRSCGSSRSSRRVRRVVPEPKLPGLPVRTVWRGVREAEHPVREEVRSFIGKVRACFGSSWPPEDGAGRARSHPRPPGRSVGSWADMQSSLRHRPHPLERMHRHHRRGTGPLTGSNGATDPLGRQFRS